MSNVDRAIGALGIEVREEYDELWALCPMHKERTGKEDHNPSWSINRTTGAMSCFSCGYSGGLIRLVCDLKGFKRTWGAAEVLDIDAAKAWLNEVALLTPVEMLKIVEDSTSRYEESTFSPISEARLALYVEPPGEALWRRGLTREAAQAYGVLWEPEKRWWITPLRDAETKKLIGWQEKGEYERYFRNYPVSMKKSRTLFGLGTWGMSDNVVVVVESPLDAVRVYAAADKYPTTIGSRVSAVATCGAKVSAYQIQLLRDADVIWALDNPKVDTAGCQASIKLLTSIKRYGIYSRFFNYGDVDAKDPGEMTDEEIVGALLAAKPAVLGKQAFL